MVVGSCFLFCVYCTLQNCSFIGIVFFVQVIVFIKSIMNTYHAAPWSSAPSPDDNHYRTTHQKRTKQHGNKEQRVLDSWTWEEILDGKGPWAQAGHRLGNIAALRKN